METMMWVADGMEARLVFVVVQYIESEGMG